jgi:hypothetical protein
MNCAIAIKSCHKYAERRQAQLDTWLKSAEADFFFLLGGEPPPSSATDVLFIRGASDAFANIAPKVLGAVEYALEQNVRNLVVCDDDTYIHWPRMAKSGFQKFDYLGFVRNYSDTPYMQGSCYSLSELAMEAVMRRKYHMKNGVPDDVAMGQCLYGEVPFTHEHRFSIGVPYPEAHLWPRPENDIIASHKMNVASMAQCHSLLTQ